MTMTEFYSEYSPFNYKLNKYCEVNNVSQDAKAQANIFLDEISIRAFKSHSFRRMVYNYVKNPSTIELKNILSKVGYENDLLLHFNAFTLIDTISIK
jgi:hypothetical protein